MDKEAVNDITCVSPGLIGFNVIWITIMSLAVIGMLVLVITEYNDYRNKRASLKREVVNLEEEPKHQGQVLDLSYNNTDEKQKNDSIEANQRQNKYSLGGGTDELKNTHEDIEDLDTPSRGSDLQNYEDVKEHISNAMPNKRTHIKVAVSEEAESKAPNYYKNQSDSDVEEEYNEDYEQENEEEEEEVIELPSQKQGFSKMAKKNLQIEVIDYEEPDDSNNNIDNNPSKNFDSNEEENEHSEGEDQEHENSSNKESED